MDKFGRYKPVVIITLLLNAVFHHSLLYIPQQEIPGVMPSAYVMRHPESGNVEVWWSPCPSRECPEEEEIDIIVDQCLDHCLLLEQNPKIEVAPPPTNAPPPKRTGNGHDIDDLNFQISKKKANSKPGDVLRSTTVEPTYLDGILSYGYLMRSVFVQNLEFVMLTFFRHWILKKFRIFILL